MLTVYLDESGHEGKVVIVAGFLGNDNQWEQCAKKWQAGLGPQRRLLHMKDLRWSKHSTRVIFAASQHKSLSGEAQISGVEYIPKDSSVLIQPSDYLVFALLQGFRDRSSKKYKWCEPILKNTQNAFGLVPDRDNLRKVIKA